MKKETTATVQAPANVKPMLGRLPMVTPSHIMALAGIVSQHAEKDSQGDFTLTPAQASAMIPVLIVLGVNSPMIAKTLAHHLNDKKGKGVFGLLSLANDQRKAFRSLADKSAYRIAKSADGDKAMQELMRENW